MRAVSLFSGCLGLDLGLEAVGIGATCYVENDKDCLRLTRARRPGVPIVEDVHAVDAALEATLDGPIEVVAGGFPCQDMSYAGRGGGFDGDRSILWFEMIRVVRELEPRLVLVENVPGLLTRGLVVVLHDLARAGYVGRWFALSAASLGAPHLRERIFVVARRADAGVRADRLDGGHPAGLFTEDGWMPLQESLLEAEPLRRLGKRGRWTLQSVYEEDARLALADDSDETLLPTPSAQESTPTDEFLDEIREAGMEPDARLYLPGRKWFTQRTLSRIAPLLDEVGDGPLLPTPGANDGTGAEGETRRERQLTGKTGGARLETSRASSEPLLPTPGAWLGRRPENAMADPERAASRRHAGKRGKRSVELPDALAAEAMPPFLLRKSNSCRLPRRGTERGRTRTSATARPTSPARSGSSSLPLRRRTRTPRAASTPPGATA